MCILKEIRHKGGIIYVITNTLNEKIDAWIEAHREELIADIQAFARIRSVSRADLAEPGAPFGPD